MEEAQARVCYTAAIAAAAAAGGRPEEEGEVERRMAAPEEMGKRFCIREGRPTG